MIVSQFRRLIYIMVGEIGRKRRIEVFRVALIIFLILLTFCGWRKNIRLMQSLNDLQQNVRTFRQMHKYSQDVCHDKGTNVLMDIGRLQMIKRSPITSQTVCEELTFILIGETLECIVNQVSWIKQRYKSAKIIVIIYLSVTVLNSESILKETFQSVYILGRYNKESDALNNAITIVTSKYFVIFDHSINLSRMNNNFVEVFLANIPGFDVLSGAGIVNATQEFNIPCCRLYVKNWSLFESYQYIVRGNVLRCDSINSLIFIGRTEAFKHPSLKTLFDYTLPEKWLQDFFIRAQGFIEVGVIPEIVIHRMSQDSNCYHIHSHRHDQYVSSLQRMDFLVPFANKHQVFFFKNDTGHEDVCKNSGGLLCSEENIRKKWNIGSFSSTGLTTFPFIIQSLKEALHFSAKCLKESKLSYVIEGGTLLGLIKARNILPWDHGDIDTFVYSTRREIIDMVMKTHRKYGYSYFLRHTGFHTYMANNPTTFNGNIVYLSRRVKPKSIIYMRHQSKLFFVKKDVFAFLRESYGTSMFENRMKYSNERNYCKIPGHHACMPDCRWHGCGSGPGLYPGIM